MRDRTLWTAPFDADTGLITGESVELANDVHAHEGFGQYSIGGDRLLAYTRDSDIAGGDLRAGRDFQLVWVDRNGLATPVIEDKASYLQPRLSPDDTRISVTIGAGTQGDLWVVDVQRGTRARLTLDARNNRRGVWTPDGSRIAFSSVRTGTGDLYLISSAGGDPELIVAAEGWRLIPGSWSPDGQTLAYYKLGASGRDIWTVTLGRSRDLSSRRRSTNGPQRFPRMDDGSPTCPMSPVTPKCTYARILTGQFVI